MRCRVRGIPCFVPVNSHTASPSHSMCRTAACAHISERALLPIATISRSAPETSACSTDLVRRFAVSIIGTSSGSPICSCWTEGGPVRTSFFPPPRRPNWCAAGGCVWRSGSRCRGCSHVRLKKSPKGKMKNHPQCNAPWMAFCPTYIGPLNDSIIFLARLNCQS